MLGREIEKKLWIGFERDRLVGKEDSSLKVVVVNYVLSAERDPYLLLLLFILCLFSL